MGAPVQPNMLNMPKSASGMFDVVNGTYMEAYIVYHRNCIFVLSSSLKKTDCMRLNIESQKVVSYEQRNDRLIGRGLGRPKQTSVHVTVKNRSR